jgi:hypothetical protein
MLSIVLPIAAEECPQSVEVYSTKDCHTDHIFHIAFDIALAGLEASDELLPGGEGVVRNENLLD